MYGLFEKVENLENNLKGGHRGMLRINEKNYKGVEEFAFDGCHKIYLLVNENDELLFELNGWENISREEFDADGYEIFPISKLQEIWDKSCPLRFINLSNLATVVEQCAEEPKIEIIG